MASIERTAYPQFKRNPVVRELVAAYTPTDAELAFITENARQPGHRLALALLLKSFQRLGYFPAVDEVPAAVVRHIYALYLQGYGTARIAHILNAEGIPPPSVYRQQHGGPAHTGSGQWSRATLHQMLTNRTYAGDLEQGRRRKVSYKSARSVRLPRSQWIVVPGTHEGLVSRADFAAVQARLARRGRGAL